VEFRDCFWFSQFFFSSALLPWVFALFFYTGSFLSDLITWSSAIVFGSLNFSFPLLVYLFSKRQAKRGSRKNIELTTTTRTSESSGVKSPKGEEEPSYCKPERDKYRSLGLISQGSSADLFIKPDFSRQISRADLSDASTRDSFSKPDFSRQISRAAISEASTRDLDSVDESKRLTTREVLEERERILIIPEWLCCRVNPLYFAIFLFVVSLLISLATLGLQVVSP